MSSIYLGISGSEVLLPTLTGVDGPAPNTPVQIEKEIESAKMSDGTYRYGIQAKKRRWSYDWAFLTLAQLTVLADLSALNVGLRLQDNHEGVAWWNVLILSFNFVELRGVSSDTDKYFAASMTIVETQ